MLYLSLKLIHVVAAIVFLGNIITGLFWKAYADRTGDPHVIAHTLEGIIRSDRWFTIPGVIAIVIAGFGTALVGGFPILGTGWILWSIVLFTISGVAFAWRVAPVQRQLADAAHLGVARGGMDWDRYHAMSRHWDFWAGIALSTPVAAVALMVLKPTLPAF